MDIDNDSHQVCRLEVVDTGRRRRWSVSEKVRIVEESLSGERQGSATARRHDIPNALLFKWRKAYREGRLVGSDAAPHFIPAHLAAPGDEPAAMPPVSPAGDARMPVGRMEIVGSSCLRIIVGADVDAAALDRVLRVLGRL